MSRAVRSSRDLDLRSARGRARYSAGPLALALLGSILVVLAAAGAPAFDLLRLEPARIGTEPWRLLTGHLVHRTWSHALLNLATLAVFAALLPPLRRARTLAMAGLGAVVAVDVGVLLLHGHLPWYAGFSGVLYGLMAGGAGLELRHRPVLGGLLLVGLTMKLALDRVLGTPAVTEALVGGKVLETAHLFGAIGGGLAAVVLWGSHEGSGDSAPGPDGSGASDIRGESARRGDLPRRE